MKVSSSQNLTRPKQRYFIVNLSATLVNSHRVSPMYNSCKLKQRNLIRLVFRAHHKGEIQPGQADGKKIREKYEPRRKMYKFINTIWYFLSLEIFICALFSLLFLSRRNFRAQIFFFCSLLSCLFDSIEWPAGSMPALLSSNVNAKVE